MRKGTIALQETVYQVSAPLRGERQLALLTDLHDRSPRLLLPSLRSHRPDLILIAGDFLHGEVPEGNGLKMEESPSLHLFRELARIAPTYVSLGNHEWMLCPEDFDCIAELNQFKTMFLGNADTDFTRDRKITFDGFIRCCIVIGEYENYKSGFEGRITCSDMSNCGKCQN